MAQQEKLLKMTENLKTEAHDFIDITPDTCPMTFVKTKLRLEKLESGEILEVLLNGGEPLKNVPLSSEELGHKVLSVKENSDQKTYTLMIQKK